MKSPRYLALRQEASVYGSVSATSSASAMLMATTVGQQAYFDLDGDRIGWMRVMCAEFQPEE